MARAHLLLLATAALTACGEPPVDLPEGCQPLLDGHDCLLPYPSDFFRHESAEGPRLSIQGAATLRTVAGDSAVPTDLERRDGFSPFGVITAVFPEPVDPTGLPHIRDDPDRSTTASAPTLIVDVETGALVPHFVDVDPRAEDDARRALVLHPLRPLAWGRRYVVALSNLRSPSGEPIRRPDGMQRALDDEAFDASVLGPLRALGLAQDDLQLAFTFTTATEASAHRDLLAMRDATLEWLDARPPTVEITRVREESEGEVWRRIDGLITVPLFLDSEAPDAVLARGSDGTPTLTGTREARFTALVPANLRGANAPGRAIVHGHGFFGSRDDIDWPRITAVATRSSAVLFSMDWRGLSTPDLGVVADVLTTHPHDLPGLTDRLMQAIVERMVLVRAVHTSLSTQGALRDPVTGAPLYQPSEVYFLGTSAGSIHGATLAAISPDLARVVLNVGGGAYTQMMFRAQPFSALLLFLGEPLPDPLDQQKFAALQQGHFDRVDSVSWADRLGARDDVQVLLQAGLGDVSVPNLGTFLVARQLGLPVLEPTPSTPWGLETTTSPARSALTLFDFGIPEDVYDTADLAPPPNDVHTAVLEQGTALDQIDAFLRPGGEVVHPCDGPCDPN